MTKDFEQQTDPAWHRWAKRMVRFFDDALRIPGTEIRFGLDAIIGLLLPGAGDSITGVGSLSMLALALRQGVPTVILLRMVMNIAIDVVVGAVPFFGDAFDLFWRSNRRNLELIEEYQRPGVKPHAGDYLIVSIGVVLAIASIVIPIVVLFYFGTRVLPDLFSR